MIVALVCDVMVVRADEEFDNEPAELAWGEGALSLYAEPKTPISGKVILRKVL